MKKVSEQYQRMKKGELFHFDDYLFFLQYKCAKMILKINKLPSGNKRREKIMNKLFNHYGSNTILKSDFQCNFGENISIGDNCYINHKVTVLDTYEVSIGNNVFIGPGVIISAVTHPNEYRQRRNLIVKKVTVEDNVWIGAGAIIFPGVTLHNGAVIGAGAVVRKDVNANAVVVGVPAHELKQISQEEITND